MTFTFEERLSASPLVERIWRTQSEKAGSFMSQAVSNWEMVVWSYEGKTNVTLRGPETKATVADAPAEAEFLGIQLKLGAFMPHLPTVKRINNGLDLPNATSQSFWLNGSAWRFPNFEDVDVFVNRLERNGLLLQDPIVKAVLQNEKTSVSSRTVRRRFLQATGLTPKVIQQIERAKEAAGLLGQGSPIADVVYQTGFSDQPHLTRSLKHFLGLTPALMVRTKVGE
jgi:AraC-like DNA-binding protein